MSATRQSGIPRASIAPNIQQQLSQIVATKSYSPAIKQRALHGYSLSPENNLEILAAEINEFITKTRLDPNISPHKLDMMKTNLLELYLVWLWIDRLEVSSIEESNLSFETCGGVDIFRRFTKRDNITQNKVNTKMTVTIDESVRQEPTESSIHYLTGAKVYTSSARLLIRRYCGWLDDLPKPPDEQEDESSSTEHNNHTISDDDVIIDENHSHISDNSDRSYHSDRVRKPTIESTDPTKIRRSLSHSTNTESSSSSSSGLMENIVDSLSLFPIERQVIIVLWHGDVDKCVELLLKAIETFEQTFIDQQLAANDYELPNTSPKYQDLIAKIEIDEPITKEYVHILSQVAMCIAGFQSQIDSEECNNDTKPNAPTVATVSSWRKMSDYIIAQLENCNRKASQYLIAGIRFLQANENAINSKDAKNYYAHFLHGFNNSNSNNGIRLNIEDQLAFAATYLNDDDLEVWLDKMSLRGQEKGVLECLLITGLTSAAGLRTLQTYRDLSSDLQSPCLLLARILYMPISQEDSASHHMQQLKQTAAWWIAEYRTLLNHYQLYIPRTALDIELGQKIQHLKMKNEEEQANAVYGKTAPLQPAPNSPPAVAVMAQYLSEILGSSGSNSSMPPSPHSQGNTRPSLASRSSSGNNVLSGSVPSTPAPPVLTNTLNIHISTLFIKCSNCKTNIKPPIPPEKPDMKTYPSIDSLQRTQHGGKNNQILAMDNYCDHCAEALLPRCYVCELHLGGWNVPNLIDKKEEKSVSESHVTTMPLSPKQKQQRSISTSSSSIQPTERDLGVIVCQSCKHGGHVNCIQEWFQQQISESNITPQEYQEMSVSGLPPAYYEQLRRDSSASTRSLVKCGVIDCDCYCMN